MAETNLLIDKAQTRAQSFKVTNTHFDQCIGLAIDLTIQE
jgi:hypothetical protein